uniref:GMC_OxRdtase_N domain-containing protein n=1 Tax=Mesocestoides corti TaxID=53468 RepID=A0A5K3EVH8_MESCO
MLQQVLDSGCTVFNAESRGMDKAGGSFDGIFIPGIDLNTCTMRRSINQPVVINKPEKKLSLLRIFQAGDAKSDAFLQFSGAAGFRPNSFKDRSSALSPQSRGGNIPHDGTDSHVSFEVTVFIFPAVRLPRR